MEAGTAGRRDYNP